MNENDRYDDTDRAVKTIAEAMGTWRNVQFSEDSLGEPCVTGIRTGAGGNAGMPVRILWATSLDALFSEVVDYLQKRYGYRLTLTVAADSPHVWEAHFWQEIGDACRQMVGEQWECGGPMPNTAILLAAESAITNPHPWRTKERKATEAKA